jgi:hypothetical protein
VIRSWSAAFVLGDLGAAVEHHELGGVQQDPDLAADEPGRDRVTVVRTVIWENRSTCGVNQRPVSNVSTGNGFNDGRSTANSSPIVRRRVPIRQASSARSHSSISMFKCASESISGTGTKWLRRNQPIWPSTPPFSWAPSIPGVQ